MKRHNHKELPCVYMILCMKNGRYYIGKTSDAWRRWEEHFFSLKFSHYKGKGAGKELMQEDMKTYGYQHFAFVCLLNRGSISMRDECEAFLIRRLNPCYNTMMADKTTAAASVDAVYFLLEEFKHKYVFKGMREMTLGKVENWTILWQRLKKLNETGISGRGKKEYTEMLQEVYPNHFTFEGNTIARIKNFEK